MSHHVFKSDGNSTHHECESFREGDWIIYKCPYCDYEMRENWRTGEYKVKNIKMNIRHSGSYFPIEYRDALINQN